MREHAPKYGTKIEDIKVEKALKMENVTLKTVENLLLFLDINEGDTATKVAEKLSRSRVEIAGQKPTRLKKEEVKKIY